MTHSQHLLSRFSLAILFFAITNLPVTLSAQNKTESKSIVETTWVKYTIPSGWEISNGCPPEVRNIDVDSNNKKYGYWMSVISNNKRFEQSACIIASKMSHLDGSMLSLEDGKNHFTGHVLEMRNCYWLKSSDIEFKGLARIKDISAAIVDGKIKQLEYFPNVTVFVRKVGNDIYTLEFRFMDDVPADRKKAIINEVYKSWQPISD